MTRVSARLNPLPSGERVARRAGEGGALLPDVPPRARGGGGGCAFAGRPATRNPLTLTLSPEGRGDFKTRPPHTRNPMP
ncbi:hypothetical protein D9623_22980 [Azospirillum brasilense]|nr:hypothetical protein D9623_22980 [Azospirillum brasilense]